MEILYLLIPMSVVLVFMIGVYLAGKSYAAAFTKRLIKRLFEKILGPQLTRNDRPDNGKG